MKGIPKQLLKSFLFSVILSIAASSIYFTISQKDADYMHALPHIMEGAVFLNVIIFVMTLPSLFLINLAYWNNRIVRFLLYFSGSAVFMITATYMKIDPVQKVIYLMVGIIFLVVHAVFYYLLVRKQARS